MEMLQVSSLRSSLLSSLFSSLWLYYLISCSISATTYALLLSHSDAKKNDYYMFICYNWPMSVLWSAGSIGAKRSDCLTPTWFFSSMRLISIAISSLALATWMRTQIMGEYSSSLWAKIGPRKRNPLISRMLNKWWWREDNCARVLSQIKSLGARVLIKRRNRFLCIID